MVWSALRLMAENASRQEYKTPDAAAITMEMSTLSPADMVSGRMFSIMAPMRPPMTMMPSSARLMTPECSE